MDLKIQQRLQVKTCIENIRNIDDLSRLFFKELFCQAVELEHLFDGGVLVLNRKFSNMMNTFKNVKYLEKISSSLASMGERHLQKYGVKIEYLDMAEKALLSALESYPKIDLDSDDLRAAWISVIKDVTHIMQQAMSGLDPNTCAKQAASVPAHFLEKIGGVERVNQVHQRFYDVMFEHPWLEGFFYGKSKSSLIMKQTQFMVGAFGGENLYKGDTPAFAHMHMFITADMLDERQKVLRQAILDEGLSIDIADIWLQIDDSFRNGIIKKTVDDCVMKCFGQVPVIIKDRKKMEM